MKRRWMKLSVLIPVYNEVHTIISLVDAVLAVSVDKQVILVDDCSNDGTREILKKGFGEGKGNINVIYHYENLGKGAAVKTALSYADGDYSVIQDGDLEYDPNDYVKLLHKAKEVNAEAVYGSRFFKTWKSTSLPHFIVNKFLTVVTNVLFRSNLTDMETCYKMIRTDIFKGLNLQSERFEIEPEITAKLLKQGHKIIEVPISYKGRSYHEGKKITWKDGVAALWTLVRWRFSRERVKGCRGI
jgi:glycosyltransferase involved in cell wall biosynthesis